MKVQTIGKKKGQKAHKESPKPATDKQLESFSDHMTVMSIVVAAAPREISKTIKLHKDDHSLCDDYGCMRPHEVYRAMYKRVGFQGL